MGSRETEVSLEPMSYAARGSMRSWLSPLVGTIAYPGLMFSGEWALRGYHESGGFILAVYATLTILLSVAIPILALRALLDVREDHRAGPVRAFLYLMFAVPSLFSLTLTLSRIVGVGEHVAAIWVSVWTTVGLVLYFKPERDTPVARQASSKWLRITHGVAALCVLLSFLVAHLINHDLALWGVELHRAAMTFLRGWYRSVWVEPVLFGLLVVVIGTGVPMVAHYARQRMDVFRVVQTATGVYVAVFLSSHLLAILLGRARGIETDWFFAAGPASLLEGTGLLNRLIPHYFFGVFAVIVHIACGLRIVLLQHGAATMVVNRAVYALTAVALLVTALSTAALLGFHV